MFDIRAIKQKARLYTLLLFTAVFTYLAVLLRLRLSIYLALAPGARMRA